MSLVWCWECMPSREALCRQGCLVLLGAVRIFEVHDSKHWLLQFCMPYAVMSGCEGLLGVDFCVGVYVVACNGIDNGVWQEGTYQRAVWEAPSNRLGVSCRVPRPYH